MIDIIETIPFPERQKWLAEHLKPMIEQFNAVFRSLAVSQALCIEAGHKREAAAELEYLEVLLRDLESLRHFVPSKD